jgi:histidyl-tRNA synthetase
MKSQMKAADRSGARIAVIVGSDELAAGTAVIRDLRHGADQVVVPRPELVDRLRAITSSQPKESS